MANQSRDDMSDVPDSLAEDDFLPEKSDPNQTDLSAFDDNASPLHAPASDDEAMKKINRRTTPFGRVVTFLLVGAVVVFGGLWFWQSEEAEEEKMQLEAIADMPPEKAVPALRELLPQTDRPKLRRRIIKNLGYYRDVASVPQLVDALDEGHVVRRAAAWALARIGSPDADSAKPKLLEVLPKTDERDRAQVVWTLAVLGETKASDAIIEQFSKGMLQQLEGFDPKVITEVLGPKRLASDKLMMHEEESVRRLTAHALAEAASASVVEPLSKLLRAELSREGEDRSQEVIRAAAAGLGRTGDPRAARPLFEVLQNEPRLGQAVLDALRKSTAGPELAVLVKEAKDTAVKRDLVRLLAATHDPRIADDLARLMNAEDAEIRETAAFGLADMRDDRAAPVLVDLTGVEDSAVVDRALGALMKVASPAISDDVRGLLDDMEHRRASILRIMGKTGDPDLGRSIEKHLDSDDVGAAAEALAVLDYDPTYDKLLRMVERPSDMDMGARNAAERSLTQEDTRRKRAAAIRAMGLYGRPEAFEALTEVVEEDAQEDYELRSAAARSIGQLATADQLATVIEKIGDANLDERSRRYYVQALWQQAHPELSSEMMSLIADAEAPIPVRRAAALAVGYTADPKNDAQLMEMLDNEDTRRHAAYAIALGGDAEAAKKLVNVLADDNDAREILQAGLMSERTEWFNLLTKEMFEREQVYRRLRAGLVMREGTDKQSFGYAWSKAVDVLRSGWDGPGGANEHFVRMELFKQLMNKATKPERRELIVEALSAIPERGLLLRARDEGGPGGEIARQALSGEDREGES